LIETPITKTLDLLRRSNNWQGLFLQKRWRRERNRYFALTFNLDQNPKNIWWKTFGEKHSVWHEI